MRVEAPASPSLLPDLSAIANRAGAVLIAVDLVDVGVNAATVDISFHARDDAHVEHVAATFRDAGYIVRHVSDRTFLSHLGGSIAIAPKIPLRTRDDLSMVYTPGVGRIALAASKDPAAARNLSIKGNSVAVVTDGSAVLGLGNLGPAGALPVMEGKCVLFKTFGEVDAYPLCLDVASPDEFVRTVVAISPGFSGINLEDVAAPHCFEIERRLRHELDIPVFHDDQHGTAIVVTAALINACKATDRKIEDVRAVVVGVGAAGHAICTSLLELGVADLVAVDVNGPLQAGDPRLSEYQQDIASRSNHDGATTLAQAMRGADLFVGVARRGSIDPALFKEMAAAPIIFALSNPDPEVMPDEVPRGAMLATGRSDLPNQVNNALCFPGFFRGALDAHATKVTSAMERAAANALASCVSPEELALGLLIPTLFNFDAHRSVAEAVRSAAAAVVGDDAS